MKNKRFRILLVIFSLFFLIGFISSCNSDSPEDKEDEIIETPTDPNEEEPGDPNEEEPTDPNEEEPGEEEPGDPNDEDEDEKSSGWLPWV